MKQESTQLSDFLRERGGRIKHEKANNLGLQRIKKIDFDGNIHLDTLTSTKTDMILVRHGDLVVSGINAAKGAISVYEGESDVLATIHYSSYKFDPNKVSVEFLKWFFTSPRFLELIKEQTSGGIKTEIKAKHILSLQANIPKFPKQLKIINRLNSLLSECLKLKSEINHQEETLSKLNQITLQSAIQGKLTVGWRNKNPDTEPANQILQKIQREKNRLISERKIRKEKPLPKIETSEIPFSIPASWAWCRLGSLGIINPRNNNIPDNREVSFVPMSAISTEYMAPIKSETRIWHDVKSGYTHIADGDVALAKITPCFENGKSILVENLVNSVGSGTTELHVLRPFTVVPNYLLIFLKNPSFINAGIPKMTGTAGQKRVPSDYFKNSLIPIPPVTEQIAIVGEVKNLMENYLALKGEIDRTKNQLNSLSQTILKQEFLFI